METIMIGSFVLNFSLFVWLVSAITGLLMLNLRWKASGIETKYSEKYTSSLFIAVLIWKFSFILFDFQSVISYPMSVLYFDGGVRGLVLGIVVATLYSMIKTKRDQTPLIVNIDALFNGWLVGNVMFYSLSLISSQAFEWDRLAYVVMHSVIWLYLNVIQRFNRSYSLLYSTFIWYFVGMIAIPFMNENRSLLWAGLTASQIVFTILFFGFITIGYLANKAKGRESSI